MKHIPFPATHLQGTKSSQPKWSVCNRTPEQAFEATWARHFGAVRPPSWCRALGEAILAQSHSQGSRRDSFLFASLQRTMVCSQTIPAGEATATPLTQGSAGLSTVLPSISCVPSPCCAPILPRWRDIAYILPLHSPGSFISIALKTAEAQERLDLVVTNDKAPALESRWLSNDWHVPEHRPEHPDPQGVVSWR